MKLIGCLLLSAAFALGQSPAEIQLKAATHKQEVEGDLKGAMEAYRQIIARNGKERGVAAQAMLRLARCHEKLGQVEARKLYEEIASSYGDQAVVAAEARERLAGMGNSSSTSTALTARHVQTSTEVDAGSLSVDGKLMVMTHWDSGDIAIRDMASGQVNRLNLKTSWDTSSDFAQTPIISQDQKQIAYAWYSTKDLFYQLRVVAAKVGAKPRILVNNPELEYFQLAGWSSDGKLILAAIWRKDQTSQLAWISASDGTIKVLKSLEWRNPNRIELSPDGRYIATTFCNNKTGRIGISIFCRPMDPEKAHLRRGPSMTLRPLGFRMARASHS